MPTLLWYNDIFELHIKRDWLAKGIYTIWDILESNRQPMGMEAFESTYNVKTNLSKYGMICKKIKDSLEWKDKPYCNHVAPTKCMLNIILSIDTKEVLAIYTS